MNVSKITLHHDPVSGCWVFTAIPLDGSEAPCRVLNYSAVLDQLALWAPYLVDSKGEEMPGACLGEEPVKLSDLDDETLDRGRYE